MLECCVDNVESAAAAERGGAMRLELCAELVLGGVSPGLVLYQQIRECVPLPIHVMVRPRSGDFLYSESEFDCMRRELLQWREAGADGVVFGILQPDGQLDAERMARLIAEAGELHTTLHRAFDYTPDALEALETAKCLGFQTVLTSGQQPSAPQGAALLADLCERAGHLTIMAGAGIDASSAAELWHAGLRAFHASGKTTQRSAMCDQVRVISMNPPGLDEYTRQVCSAEKIAALRSALDVLAHESKA